MTEISATATTRSGAVGVRATEGGLPIELHIDRHELRFSGAELAATVLQLCLRASDAARVQRRTLLEREGVDSSILDRLGLPRASTVADAENDLMDSESPPTSWLRSV